MSVGSATRIVFDLDGTLVQTRVASWEVFREVQAEFDLGIDTEQKYFALLEDNLFVSLRRLCRDESQADAVTTRFLDRLETDYHPELVPGMSDVIHALAGRATLAVLSSNATSVIRRVLDANELQWCFSHVFGGDIERDKSAGLRRFLADAAQGAGRRCSAPYDEVSGPESATHADTVLVTDTTGDIEAAAAAGVRAVGVSWGMHTSDQLRAAGAEFVAVWPQELISYLRPDKTPAGGSEGACRVGGDGGSTRERALGGELVAAMTARRARRREGGKFESSPAPRESSGGCGCAVESISPVPAASVSGLTREVVFSDVRDTELLEAMKLTVGRP